LIYCYGHLTFNKHPGIATSNIPLGKNVKQDPKMFCNWQQKVNSHHGKYQYWETTGAGKTNIQTTIMWKTITSREWVLHLQALLTTSYGYLQWLQRILLSLLTDLPQSRVDRCFSETSALLFITAWNDLQFTKDHWAATWVTNPEYLHHRWDRET